jgi:hypothetical protein
MLRKALSIYAKKKMGKQRRKKVSVQKQKHSLKIVTWF